MRTLHGRRILDVDVGSFEQLTAACARIVVDVGAGDGHASLRLARRDSATFAIAIDPSVDRLRESARTALRQKIANVLFVVASIEVLPDELRQRADEVTVSFPWGTLLAGVVRASADVLGPLARLAKPDALVRILLSVEPRDAHTTGLPPVAVATLMANANTYRDAGFAIEHCADATREEIAQVGSSWGKRLGADRHVVMLVLRRLA